MSIFQQRRGRFSELRLGTVPGCSAAGVVAFAAALCSCGPNASEDERGSIGVPTPPVEYCQALGYTAIEDRCEFPDGTACEQWSFYRGSCGQEHSYCQLHGGQVTSETHDMGTWTAVMAVCTIDGKRCKEDPLFRTGECEAPPPAPAADAGQ